MCDLFLSRSQRGVDETETKNTKTSSDLTFVGITSIYTLGYWFVLRLD